MSIRLNKVLTELNIGLQTAVEFLKNKKSLGEIKDDANVNTKISDEQYQALVSAFKEGDFRGYRDGRWYTDMTPEGLRGLAEETGFEVLDMWESVDRRGVRWVSGILGLQPS